MDVTVAFSASYYKTTHLLRSMVDWKENLSQMPSFRSNSSFWALCKTFSDSNSALCYPCDYTCRYEYYNTGTDSSGLYRRREALFDNYDVSPW